MVTAPGLLSASGGKAEKPNILWVVMEDTSPQFIGCYGNGQVKTPNIDRLAREGVRFNNAFATAPVCSAARSTIITGVNTERLGTGNHRSKYPIPGFITGFPSYLRGEGYYASNNAKKDYSTCNEQDLVRASWDESNNRAGWWDRRKEQPFFSVFNYITSHQSRKMTYPWSWYEEFILGKLSAEGRTLPGEISVPPIFRESEEMRRYLSRVYNSINLTDRQIGLLLDSLERHGLMESTIIFLYADHGEGIPRGKTSSVGLGYRVPFVVWFPEKYKHLSPWKTGRPTEELVSFEDLGPTLLSLAGVKPPEYMTGRPFMGRYRMEPRKYVYGSRNRIDETPGLARTLTDGRFFYVRVFQPRYPSFRYSKYLDVADITRLIRKEYGEGKLDRNHSIMLERRDIEYLYDLDNDPWELNNLAEDPAYDQKLAEMRKVLHERLVDDEDVLFLPEYEIAEISGYTTPYEYRLRNDVHLQGYIDAAYKATDPGTKPNELLAMLESDDPVNRYWGVVGIHNRPGPIQIPADKHAWLLSDPYPPVAIESAGLIFGETGNEKAGEILKAYMLDRDYCLSLHALQMVEYLPEVPGDILDTVEQVLEKRTGEADGYEYAYDICVCCEMILYLHRGRPLYYERWKKWTDPAHMSKQNT